MENQQNEITQIKNLLGEVNNHIIQINDRIIQINNIITQINNIMLNNNNLNQKNIENQKIDNFIQIMKGLKVNINNNDILSDLKNEQKLLSIKKEEKLSEEVIETVMNEGRCSREEAIKALINHNGDPVEALVEVEGEYNPKENNSIKKEILSEEDLEKEVIETVMYEGKCSREEAIKALLKYNGDPVEALLEVGK